MSRRCHHGSPRHVRNGRDHGRPLPPERPRGERAAAAPGIDRPGAAEPTTTLEVVPAVDSPPAPPDTSAFEAAPELAAAPGPQFAAPAPLPAPTHVAPVPALPRDRRSDRPRLDTPSPAPSDAAEATVDHGATAPQLRRFIKSRAYVPMHELRRRFAINGGDDEVTVVDVDRQRVFVGLPEREGRLLGELLRGGDIGYELSLDPISPIVVGVYPMRPVTRA